MTLNSAAESGKSSTAAGDEGGRRKTDLGFGLQGPRRITDPTKDQSISSSSGGSSHIVPRARQALVVMFDTSTTWGRTPILLFPPLTVSCAVFGLVQDSTWS